VTRILIVAASAIVRAGLESLVATQANLTVIGSAARLDSLASQIEDLQPDVIVVDLEPETEDAVGTLLALSREVRSSSLIVLADDTQGAWVGEAVRAGVHAILPREMSAEEIVAAIEAVASGFVVLQPEALDHLLRTETPVVASSSPPRAAIDDALTPREVEVLRMIAEGSGNKIIAWRLSISEHTVKFHVASIFSKLNVSNRTEAVTVGIKQGLVML